MVPDGNPKHMDNNLRQAARPIIAFSRLYGLSQHQTTENLAFISQGADYLLRLQHESGLFPAPDLRGDNSYYASYNKRALKKNPEAIEDGWFVDDYRGELQSDNAVSGVAMISAYNLTKDQRYLDSARKSTDWALSKGVDTNWAYNAFSVWLLAEFYQLTNETKYLDGAIEKIKLGVFPGQLKNGRWFDPITTKLIYHSIIVRGLLSVYIQLGDSHAFKQKLKERIISAVNNAAMQITRNGASSVTTSTAMLIEASQAIGKRQLWEDALSINLNASLHYIRNKKAPRIGSFLSNYIVYKNFEKETETSKARN